MIQTVATINSSDEHLSNKNGSEVSKMNFDPQFLLRGNEFNSVHDNDVIVFNGKKEI